MAIQVFLQSELLSDIAVIELDDAPTPKDLRRACAERVADTQVDDELFLFIEDDDDEDAIDNLKSVTDGLRLHLHRLKAIDVAVHYAGKAVRRTFRPNATIARVKRWAGNEFGIAPSDAAELMLQLAGTNTRPDPDVHLGSLVKAPQYAICFDLVPAPRVNG
jgi:hypothetical protein